MRSVFVLTVLLLHSARLLAHSGHGPGDGTSPQHYVTSPYHAGPVLGLLATITMVWFCERLVQRTAKAKAERRDRPQS